MIKINRGPEPKYFSDDRIVRAKQRLKDNFAKTDRVERLQFDMSVLRPIKEEVANLTNGKCAYCESKLGMIISLGEIESFRPKGGARGFNSKEYAPKHYWWLAFEWENLLPACRICNQKYKRDYFPLADENLRSAIGALGDELLQEGALLIDPCAENPAEHLEFEENGFVREISKKGGVTIEILGLNRGELVEQRRKEVFRLRKLLEELSDKARFSTKSVNYLLSYINELYSDAPSQEFVAVQRTVFDNWYERNSAIWEQVKKNQNDTSETILQPKTAKSMPSHLKEEMVEVNASMSDLKRFSIKEIAITNFKSIAQLTLNMKAINEKNNSESWLLLLGDNGIGKSSILQAIALALTTKKQLAKLNLDVTDYLKTGTDSGSVVIHSYEHDKPVVLTFDKNGFVSELEDAPTFVLGYGSTRLLPKGNIQSDKAKEPYMNIKNLFDYSVALNDPNAWLSGIDTSEFNERVGPAFFDILALRDGDKIWTKEGKIIIDQYGASQELEDNSDGYKTITALVSDIMQTLSIDKANYHNSQGIVLIDELGNHLHPRWRMKIAVALRKAFPKLQFIVTTHEPLCLIGLSHGEVDVLIRDRDHNLRLLDGDKLPDHNLMSIEQLLTSDLFGLINTNDDEIEETYKKYYSSLSKTKEEQTEEDKSRIEEFAVMMADKEMIGNTPKEQVLYKIIDEVFVKKMREDGFKTTETLKDETIKTVKEILTSKNLDWL